MKRLAFVLLLSPLWCGAGTVIQDTIYTGFPPQVFQGRLTISGPPMTTQDGRMISRWSRDFLISDGKIEVELEPNDTATPAGTSYYVVYRPKSGVAWSEYWVVPTSATPLTIGQVRVTQPPNPQMVVQLGQIASGGAETGQCIQWDGVRWAPGECGGDAPVTSVFGRTGAITAQAGDYDTDKVPEGSVNKYYLDSRARAALAAQSPLAYDSESGVFSCPSCAVLSGGTENAMAYWTGTSNLGSSSVLSTDETNRKLTVSLQAGGSVKIGDQSQSFEPLTIDFQPPDAFSPPYPQGLRLRFVNSDGTFDPAVNSFIEHSPWSQQASLNNFVITGMVKRLKNFTYGTTASGTGTLTTHSCGTTDGCLPSVTGDYLYTVNYYLTTTAGSGGTAFLTITWTDLKGARTFVTPALPLHASGYVQGQLIVQLKQGTINITPGWENASGSPSVSWAYLIQR